MFGMFKRKDKNQEAASEEAWGQPSQRKLSKDEAAREAAAQKLVEAKNLERREMYRPAGREKVFQDRAGHQLALRTEDNSGPEASEHHPPLQILAFWGVREIAYIRAEIEGQQLRETGFRLETGFENHGIEAELLKEMEAVAREKGLQEMHCTGQESSSWNADFLTQAGFSPDGAELVKSLN